MNIDYFHHSDGQVICQNRHGLTFYLEGQPSTPTPRAAGSDKTYPTFPGDTRSEAGRRGEAKKWA